MKKYIQALATMLFVAAISLGFTSCSSDDDEPGGGSSYGSLTVNGQKWDVGSTVPNYDESGFYYIGVSKSGVMHTIACYEALTEYEVGDEVPPAYLVLGTENAEYSYEDGEVTVVKKSGKNITLKFDNYTVAFTGLLVSALGDGRGPDIANANTLEMNGTVTFVYHTLPD